MSGSKGIKNSKGQSELTDWSISGRDFPGGNLMILSSRAGG